MFSGNDEALLRLSLNNYLDKAKSENKRVITFSFLDKEAWDELILEMQTKDLFSQKTIVVLKVKKATFAKKSAEQLEKAMALSDNIKQLLVVIPKIKRATETSQWYQYAFKNGAIVEFNPLSTYELKQWTLNKLKVNKNTITQDALDLLLEKTEGNLEALVQEIEKINLSFDNCQIEKETLTETLFNQGNFNLYQWVDSCLNQDIKRASMIFQQLKTSGTEVILLLWALSKEIKTLAAIFDLTQKNKSLHQACLSLKIWQSKIHLYEKTLKIHNHTSLKCLHLCNHYCDNLIKGTNKTINPWDFLEAMSLYLMTKNKTVENQLNQHLYLADFPVG